MVARVRRQPILMLFLSWSLGQPELVVTQTKVKEG